MREILHRIVQGFGECLNERTASGRACLIELHTVNGLVFDFDTFHVLTADIKNAVYIRLKESGGIVVCNSLYFAFIQHKGGLDQCFAVAGGAGVYDLHTFRKQLINILDGADCGSQRIPVIVMVERVEECSVFAYQRSLCGRGTGVDPEECLSAICTQILYRHLVFCVPGGEFLVFCIGCEQGFQTFYFDFHLYFTLQSVLKFS